MAEPAPAPAPQRGRLDLADRVVEKIAVRAALECAGVVSTAEDRSSVGDAVQWVVRTDLPRAQAQVGTGATRVAVRIAVRWPCPLPATTAAVRARVGDQVARLTGLRVDGVDVSVSALTAGTGAVHERRVQ